MDFASLMSAQISKSKSKPQASSAPSSSTATTTTTATTPSSTYLKRSQVEAARAASYAASQAQIESERASRAAQKRKHEEEELERDRVREDKKRRLAEESRVRREEEEKKAERLRRKRLGLPELPPPGQQEGEGAAAAGGELDDESKDDIDDEQLRTKLRALNEPATLFGENHSTRLKRYRKLTGTSTSTTTATATTKILTNGPIPTTLALVPEAEMKVLDKVAPKDTPERAYLFRQLASYFTMVLREWERALGAREQAVKESFQGKAAHNAMVQSRENMRPLFKKFERGELEDGVLEPIVDIVRAAQERRYVDANDGYLTLSIGKAAWPIGVTMVGIHERSAREKLHESDKQAHIMSDEVTRKFLQSIKRCLSFAQTRWPPDDQLQLMG